MVHIGIKYWYSIQKIKFYVGFKKYLLSKITVNFSFKHFITSSSENISDFTIAV